MKWLVAIVVWIQSVTPGSAAVATRTAVRVDPPQSMAPPNFPIEPAPRCAVLDNFGDARSGGRRHQGVDIMATLGQEVYAMAAGTLTKQIFAGTTSGALSGNSWTLTLPPMAGATTPPAYYMYAHLSAFAPGLRVGSLVSKGQLIGFVGDTGNPGAGNYHLHFEVHPTGGAAVNPLPLLTIPQGCNVW